MRKINANNLNHMELDSMKSVIEIQSLMGKLDKGNRKYEIKLYSTDKKMILSFLKELVKSFDRAPKNLINFIYYLETASKRKKIYLSYDEIKFIKSLLLMNLAEIRNMRIPWYRFFKRIFISGAKHRSEEIVKRLKI